MVFANFSDFHAQKLDISKCKQKTRMSFFLSMKCEVRWEIREKYHCVVGGARQFYCTTLHRRKVDRWFLLDIINAKDNTFSSRTPRKCFFTHYSFRSKNFQSKTKNVWKIKHENRTGLKKKVFMLLNLTNIYNVGRVRDWGYVAYATF